MCQFVLYGSAQGAIFLLILVIFQSPILLAAVVIGPMVLVTLQIMILVSELWSANVPAQDWSQSESILRVATEFQKEMLFWTNVMSVVEQALLVLVVIISPSVAKYLTLAEFVMEMIPAATHARILVLIAPEDFWTLVAFAAGTINLAQGVMAFWFPRK